MKRIFYRIFHIAVPILVGLDVLNIIRYLGSMALIISCFTFNEPHSGLSIRFKIIQELCILSAMLILGALIQKNTFYLFLGGVVLFFLFLEWKFRAASKRWEQ